MKIIEIFGEGHEHLDKRYTSCRGIILHEGKILLSHERMHDYYSIPGGGLEEGENKAACCAREIAEETGCIVDPVECFVVTHEFYGDSFFDSYFFTCEVRGTCEPKLTSNEIFHQLHTEWHPLEKAIEIFSRYEEYRIPNVDKTITYRRDFNALNEFADIIKNKK